MWFCPECYTHYRKRESCACETPPLRKVAFNAPDEFPLVCGHLTFLDDTPGPGRLFEQICDGPLLYPSDSALESRCCSWRHKANTLWVWQRNAEDLPQVGTLPSDDETSIVSLLRILPFTGLFLLEAPQQTPLFLAHYARNNTKRDAPSSLSLIIDRLQSALELSAHRARAIALFDPGSSVVAQDLARLDSMCEAFSVFARRDAAQRWLLQVGKASRSLRAVPHYWLNEPATSSSTVSELSQESDANRPARVAVVDVGGSAGRQMLARLHQETYRAATNPKRKSDDAIKLQGRLMSLSRLRAEVSVNGLRFGQVQELRNGHVVPGIGVPAWNGERVRWMWFGGQSFTVTLQYSNQVDSLILGIGNSRFFGERELAALLEGIWQGGCGPAAIICADHFNTELHRWVRNEFPKIPEFPDSWEGGMQALETALRVAQNGLSQ